VELLDNLGRFLPWTVLLPAGVWWWWRDRDPRRRPLLAWTVVIAVAVSLSGEQRARYFVPVLPPMALLVGELLVDAPRDRAGRRVLVAFLGATLLVVLALVVILLWLPLGAGLRGPSTFMPAAGWERGLACLLALAGLAGAAVLTARGAGFGATTVLAVALGGVLLVEGWGYPARFTQSSNIRAFTVAMAGHLAPDSRVLAYPDAGLSYDFYLRRPVRELSGAADLEAELSAPGPDDVLLIRESRWTALRSPLQDRWQVLMADRVGREQVLLLGPRR
jgi:hypothetical protein